MEMFDFIISAARHCINIAHYDQNNPRHCLGPGPGHGDVIEDVPCNCITPSLHHVSRDNDISLQASHILVKY